jgi:hypothetical protein
VFCEPKEAELLKELKMVKTLAAKSAELALATPQVMAHRLTRMAFAGASPNRRDRDEFSLMKEEKVAAFNESWQAMMAQTVQTQQQICLSMIQTVVHPAWFAWTGVKMPTRSLTQEISSAASDILSKGIDPVHKRAVANAKRLGREKII